MTTELEILESIDSIDSCVQESSLNIAECLSREYAKISLIGDYTDFDPAIIMEGTIMDTATGKGKNESTLWKILAFIPRLIIGIVKAAASIFTKDYDKANIANAKAANGRLAKATNDELNNARDNVQKESDGEMDFDPAKKQFFLTKVFRHIRNYIRIITGLMPVLKKLHAMLDGADTSYLTLAKEIGYIVTGQKSIDQQTKYITVDVLKELAEDGGAAAKGACGVLDEIRMKLEKKIHNDFDNGKNIDDQMKAKALLDNIYKGADKVRIVTKFCNVAKKILSLTAIGKLFKKIREAGEYDETVDPDLASAKAETKELKARNKGLKQEEKEFERKHKKLMQSHKELQKLQKKNEKLQKKVARRKEIVDTAGKDLEADRNMNSQDWKDFTAGSEHY